jgi:hypothetical protein
MGFSKLVLFPSRMKLKAKLWQHLNSTMNCGKLRSHFAKEGTTSCGANIIRILPYDYNASLISTFVYARLLNVKVTVLRHAVVVIKLGAMI